MTFLIVTGVFFVCGIALYIVTNKTLNKKSITIIQGKLDDGEGDDIQQAMKYLKITNKD